MEILTVILIIALILAVVGILVMAVVNWGKWDDRTRQAVITQLYGLAKTVFASISDGNISQAEKKAIFTSLLAVIAACRGTTLDTVQSEFPPMLGSDEPDDEEIHLRAISTDNILAEYDKLPDDALTIASSLNLAPKDYLYGIVTAPGDIAFRIVVSNDRYQKYTWNITPTRNLTHAVIRCPFRVFPPGANGWVAGQYTIHFSVESQDGATVYDAATIPAIVSADE